MAKLTADQIGRLQQTARKNLNQWLTTIQEAVDLAFPNRDATREAARGQQLASENWDGTAPQAVLKFADRMMEFTPPGGEFIVLEPGPFAELISDGGNLATLREELQRVGAMCNAAVQSGGFFTSTHEMYLDWAVGIGGQIVNEADVLDPSAIARFEAVPLGTFYVEDGPGGRVHRRWRWPQCPMGMVTTWWRDAKLPEEWTRKMAEDTTGKSAEKAVNLVEVEYFDWDATGKDAKPWCYAVVCKAGGGESWHTLVERRGRTSQWLTPRYAKRAGESMGRGPLLSALPDIRTANKVVELTFRAIVINLLGIWLAEEGSVNPNVIRLQPAAVIPVRRTGGPNGASLQRADTGNVRPDFAAIILDDVRMNIKRGLMDAMLPPETGPVRSATEVAARLRELALDMPGAYGRIIDEFIVPLVQRLIDIMHRRGLIPNRLVIDQLLVKVSVSSPVAREQRMAEVERIVQWLEMLQALGGRELMLVGAVLEEVPEKLADLMGIDRKIVQDEAARRKMQENMAKVVAAQQQAAGPTQTQAPGPVPMAA